MIALGFGAGVLVGMILGAVLGVMLAGLIHVAAHNDDDPFP